MATTSQRNINIQFTGDIDAGFVIPAAVNLVAAAKIDIVALTTGANTISIPAAGTVPTSVTILPIAGNTASITLKGVVGDTGVRIHDTDPTSIALDDSVTSIILTAGDAIASVRLYWT